MQLLGFNAHIISIGVYNIDIFKCVIIVYTMLPSNIEILYSPNIFCDLNITYMKLLALWGKLIRYGVVGKITWDCIDVISIFNAYNV